MAGDVLNVVEHRDVDFYGDELTAIRADDGNIYVGLRRMCQLLGVDTQGQRQRIDRHQVLREGLRESILQTAQGPQRSQVLRVDMVPLWLSGVRTSAVVEEIRPKLERLQREAAKVLWEAFREGRLTSDVDFDTLLAQDTPEAQAYKMAQAVMQLARSQLFMRGQIAEHEQRLEAIEAQLGDTGRHVTPDQASQLSQAVKAVALAQGKKSGRNEFGAVYGELYRKFGITSYKALPARRFDEAMRFLTEWHESLIGETPF
ncbi:MAG: phage antirepressor N-terminal domain-containing protein [Chloroflexota bacterium]